MPGCPASVWLPKPRGDRSLSHAGSVSGGAPACQVGLGEPGVTDTDPWHEMDQLIDELEAGLDPEHRALHAPHFAGERQSVGKIQNNANPPERVAATVERQLTRRRMRPRTLVGVDARFTLGMKALLPARGLDAVRTQGIGI